MEQARLIGSLLITEFYEAAITCPSGAKPHYLFVDEAAQFVTPELGLALEQCRQKGLHLSLAFQHLAQFKEESMRLYKAVKNNTRNKLVFAIPDRQDAMEIADDLFDDLASPEVKYMHRRLSHRLEDVREQSFARSMTDSKSFGQNFSEGDSDSRTSGSSRSSSSSRGQSQERTFGTNRSFSRGKSFESATNQGHTHSEHEVHSYGYSESRSREEHSASSSSDAVHTHSADSFWDSRVEDGRSRTEGRSGGQSSSYSRTDTGSDSYDSGDSYSEGSTQSRGGSRSTSWGRSRQASYGRNESQSTTDGENSSYSAASSTTSGRSTEQGHSRGSSVTDQPGTRHIPFIEEDLEFWSLEEQRWRASEQIMRQPVGECFIRSGDTFGKLRIKRPKKFYIRPGQLVESTRRLYEQHCLTREAAEAMVAERQARLLALAAQQSTVSGSPAEDITYDSPPPIWNRVPPSNGRAGNGFGQSTARKRGPATDVANYAKVRRVIEKFGARWTEPDTLAQVCTELDRQHVPPPKTWLTRTDGVAKSWTRGRQHYSHLVIKAIKDRLKALNHQTNSEKLSPTSAASADFPQASH